MATTAKDIANRVGISRQSVSRILSNATGYSYSDDTRERVLAAAAELQYSPNMVARGLKNNRLNLLGACFPQNHPTWITSTYYGISVLTGIITGAYDHGYSTTIFHRPWRDAKQSAAGFRGQGIDGYLVVAPTSESDMVSGLTGVGIPVVAISSQADELGVPSVCVDNRKGVRLVLDHLIGLGHRRIAHLTESLPQFDWVTRRETFLTDAAESGIPVPPDFARPLHRSFDSRGFYHHVRYLLSLPEPPTAIFATNDGVAMEAIEAARDLGITVPGQLSVVGFDDEPNKRSGPPPLTTVRYDISALGQTAANLLIALIEGEPVPPVTHLFAPELVVRESTAVRP